MLPCAEGRRAAASGAPKSRLVFVQVLRVDRLTGETCARTELRDVCVGAPLGAPRPLLGEDPAPEWPR
ncbi:hypothetical protein ACGH2B_27255 [Streptomyces sp. BBFR2]|uniref:hypothetical protein n=1 Tax=Streptomyces sp. BBFR2 TaxID=3372854 RepID=UPI0037D9B4CD